MCECRADIEKRLLTRFQEMAPDAKDHSASLDGYSLTIVKNVWTSLPSMPIKMTAQHPLKKGGFKRKTETSTIMFNYCPFCGVKLDND